MPSPADVPDLSTDRLRLRRPLADDAGAIVAIVGQWDVARRLARVPHPYTMSDAAYFLREIVPAEWTWAICDRNDERLIGMVGLAPDDGAAGAELGYWLAPQCWGRGIVSEAVGTVVALAFGPLGLTHLTSGHADDNPASGRVLEKHGFVETGRAVLPCLATGGDMAVRRLRLDQPGSGSSRRAVARRA